MAERWIHDAARCRTAGVAAVSPTRPMCSRRNSDARRHSATHDVQSAVADRAPSRESGCSAIDATGRGAQNWSNSAAIIGSLEQQVGLAPTFCYWEI